jgi:hypothetical protein
MPQKALTKRTKSSQFLHHEPGWLPKLHLIAKAKRIFGDALGVDSVSFTSL